MPLSPKGSHLQVSLKSIVSATDGLTTNMRTMLSLPQGPASSVTIVTDGSVCTSLANAEAVLLNRPARRVIHVFAIGASHYVVVDEGPVDAGEFDQASFYDAQFNYIVSMTF